MMRLISCVAILIGGSLARGADVQFADLGDFQLENGQTLRQTRIGYHTYGRLNSDRSNVVLWPSWFNGIAADIEKFVGPGLLIDSNKYYVITVDALGNGVSTSPSNAASGQRGGKFPKVSLRDMVGTQHRLLTEKLNIKNVYAVMGVSMGAMQAYQWMVQYPDFMERSVTIVGTPKMGAKEILLWSTMLKGVKLPGGGNAGETGEKKGFLDAFAKPAASLIPPDAQEQLEFVLNGMEPTANANEKEKKGGGIPDGAMAYLKKNPYDIKAQFQAMITHDISRTFSRSMDRAAQTIRARNLTVIATQDKAVSPGLPKQFAGQIRAEILELTGSCGHKAYDCEKDKLGPVIAKFLDGR
jgi:homoserine O-acetyltransferase